MGQNSSAQLNLSTNTAITRSESVKTKGPPKRPAAPPQPKIPNYVVEGNKVLPGNIPLDGRSNLRPVSQELSKFMPEIADIYKAEDSDEGFALDFDGDKENHQDNTQKTPIKQNLDGPIVTPDKKIQISKGFENNVKSPNGVSTPRNSKFSNGDNNYCNGDSGNNDSGIFEHDITINGMEIPNGKVINGVSHTRTNSLDRNAKIKGHRRQQSTTTSLLNNESTIFEDPREHLYNEWRKDPYSNSLPSGSSLPVKSNFEMDESFNLTYAQLAEARRKSTLEELERRTGKKISDLSDDLAVQSNAKPSPFDHYNYMPSMKTKSFSVASSTSTASSSDTGVSKRKKKRAPQPPNQNGIIEPPVDYNLDFQTNSMPRTKRQLSTDSSYSTASNGSTPSSTPRKKGPAPTPGGVSPRTNGVTKITVSRSNSFKSPPVMPKPARQLSELELRLQSVRDQVEEKIEKGLTEDADTHKDKEQKEKEEQREKEEQKEAEEKKEKEQKEKEQDVKEQQKEKEEQRDEVVSMSTDTISTMSDNISLYSVESRTKSDTNSVQMEEVKPKLDVSIEAEKEVEETIEKVVSEVKRHSSNTEELKQTETITTMKTPTKETNQKKLSSLLQHDIILAAQARGSRIVKQTTPVPSKPKDEQAVFKEQLSKALTDRDDRMKRSQSIDELMSKTRFQAQIGRVVVSKKEPEPSEHMEPPTRSVSVTSPVKIPPKVAPKKVKSLSSINNLGSSTHTVNGEQNGSIVKSQSSDFSKDWTPEDDLGSDEDMTDQVFYSHQRTTSEGFKSQIIPGKVQDLKTGSLQRPDKKNRKYKQAVAVPDDANKYGSIRKLKKTVHKGVKNAFGSLSRASGKLLRRQRNSDLGDYQTDQTNWRLSSTNVSQSYPTANSRQHSDSEDSDSGGMGVEDIRFDLPDDPPASEQDVKNLKRAGVAYVSGHGQIVVLPDFTSTTTGADEEENEGRAPKIHRRKKKKLSYESTVRQQERQQWEEQIAEQIKQKELEMERERVKQMEMELEYRRLRDLSSQEKLQKLQSEQMQQQIQALQNQQGIGVPPTHHKSLHNLIQPSTTYNPILTSNIPQQPALGINYNPIHQTMTSMPNNFTSSEMNQMGDYMRMMGVSPPSTSQQWAYLLNSVTPSSPIRSHHTQSMFLAPGPDLSMLFGGKTMDDSKIHQKQPMMNHISNGPVRMHGSEMSLNGQMSFEKKRMIDIMSNGRPAQMELDHASIGTLLTDFHHGPQNVISKSKKEKRSENSGEQRANPVYYSSDEEVDDQLSPAKTNQGIVRVQVEDNREIPVPSMVTPTSGQIVYDDAGFKTVIFNPAYPSLSPRELDDSSSGADR
ncbi:rac guanine nucleotide exchange factor JJ [Patella vulgata]|uniref:rac guanine nucleotide exchange factor JJ n=1 Tax=Patella vulgata TaxID=6465 RepID=UPI0021800658|nr:rac guanine nucleotide exchange factor JJ [Patella vulgata]XP_050408697.1 rac guanine nucleotide exchange factor JJ [Patella vulgata]